MKNLVIFLFLLSLSTKSNCQQVELNNQKYYNYIKDRAKSIISDLDYTITKDLIETNGVSIEEYFSDGTPKRALASFKIGSVIGKEWRNIEDILVNVLFKNGLPFAISGDRYLRIPYRQFPVDFYSYKDEVSKNKNKDFTEIQKSYIRQTFKNFQYDLLNSNLSYLEVLKKHKEYPLAKDIKNKLGILFLKKETYKIVWNDNPDFNVIPFATEKNPDMVSNGLKDFKYYKNISNQPIILKGIRQEYGDNQQYHYVDVSVELKPGEVYPFFEINKSFNPENVYNNFQFIGETGFIKKLYDNDYIKNNNSNVAIKEKEIEVIETDDNGNKLIYAKVIGKNRIEIDSYTNATKIKINKGDIIEISAYGTITYGVWAGSGGPDGIEGYTSYNIIQDSRHGRLLVKVGDDNWIPVGKKIKIVAKKSGYVDFMVNDSDPSNNSGSFLIDYKITKLKK